MIFWSNRNFIYPSFELRFVCFWWNIDVITNFLNFWESSIILQTIIFLLKNKLNSENFSFDKRNFAANINKLRSLCSYFVHYMIPTRVHNHTKYFIKYKTPFPSLSHPVPFTEPDSSKTEIDSTHFEIPNLNIQFRILFTFYIFFIAFFYVFASLYGTHVRKKADIFIILPLQRFTNSMFVWWNVCEIFFANKKK